MEPEQTSGPGLWTRLRDWLGQIHFRLMTINDTPHSIALGVAIGIFFGFSPLWSLKTLLSIAVAWLLKCNKIAAAVSVSLHDFILPFMPAIFLWEYKLGFWIQHGHLPQRFRVHALGFRSFAHWETFVSLGGPLLIGSVLIGLPSAVVAYFVGRGLVTSYQAARARG
ncbi:MAG: DUF2062 domain-containing protein [Verrucomicrobiota bacterium]|nr:DUF2062 domain-containing protein [Verrucomicrobiota bacterium]